MKLIWEAIKHNKIVALLSLMWTGFAISDFIAKHYGIAVIEIVLAVVTGCLGVAMYVSDEQSKLIAELMEYIKDTDKFFDSIVKSAKDGEVSLTVEKKKK